MEQFTTAFQLSEMKMQLCSILFFAMMFATVVSYTTQFLTNIPTVNWWEIDIVSYSSLLTLPCTPNLSHTGL